MYAEAQLAEIARLARSVAGLPGRVVEIGCWEGRSTVALANACFPDVLVAVDWWRGNTDEGSQTLVAVAAARDVHATFAEHVAALTAGNVDVRHQDSAEFLAGWAEPVKFCHLDAGHSYAAVRGQIAALLPLIVTGGILCGDDYHHPPVQRAVAELLPDHRAGVKRLWTWTRAT